MSMYVGIYNSINKNYYIDIKLLYFKIYYFSILTLVVCINGHIESSKIKTTTIKLIIQDFLKY